MLAGCLLRLLVAVITFGVSVLDICRLLVCLFWVLVVGWFWVGLLVWVGSSLLYAANVG